MPDYKSARRHLMRRDPRLGALIKKVGACRLGHGPETPPFVVLSYSIASQQLSVKAADTIFGRFCDLFPPDRVPDPAKLVSMHPDTIRAVGFSRPKVGFLQDLAAHVVDRRLPLDALHAMPDDEVLKTLTAVKGIGRWTAEVFLMFRLGRLDVFPADDLGLVKAMQRVYGLKKRPSRERMMKMAETWRPYRSVAAWYLWSSLSEMGTKSKEQRTKRTEQSTKNKKEERRTTNGTRTAARR